MPEWRVHDKWAERLGISKEVSREVNAEIDSIDDPRFHDYGRVIVLGRWDFSYLYPVLRSFLERWRREDAVKAFLLHHILDYMDALLSSPSVQLSNAINFIDKLISNLRVDAERNLRGELRDVVIRSCSEIHELIKGNVKEIIADLKREYGEGFEWAEERLLRLYCEKCGRQFTTIDSEARELLASRGVGIPESFLRYCIRCRGMSLSRWLEDRMREPHTGFHRYRYHPSPDEYWMEMMNRVEALIYVLKLEELKELNLA